MNLIRWEELSDVVLCGHSYGGCVISGVADRLRDRVRALVYLDGFVLEDGESMFDLSPRAQAMRDRANANGDGWNVSPNPPEIIKVNPRDAEWVRAQCTSQFIATFEEPIKLTRALADFKNATYIFATGHSSVFQPSLERAKTNGWQTRTIDCGHDAMLDLPEELTAMLLEAASVETESHATL